MKKATRSLTLLILFFCGLALVAQTNQAGAVSKAAKKATIILEYFDEATQIKIFSTDGFEYGEIFPGMELSQGDRIQTQKTTAELRLDPNGSIIKISANTGFQVNALKNSTSGTNEFSLLAGKIRTVAAKTGGITDYRFKTPTAICGVRGTDFGMEVQPDKMDRLVVREGLVDFTQSATGKTINIASGMGADTFAPSFAPSQFTTKDLADF